MKTSACTSDANELAPTRLTPKRGAVWRVWATVFAVVVGAIVAVGATAGTAGTVEAASASSKFAAQQPCRVLDTRVDDVGRLAASGAITVQLAQRCNIPDTATAVNVTTTAVRTTGAGFLTIWPAGAVRPTASTLNWTPRTTTIANTTITALGEGGAVSVFVANSTHLVIDVRGYFTEAASSSDGRFVPLRTERVIDTRHRGGRMDPQATITVAVPGDVPADAVAVTANITVVSATKPGHVTAWASGKRPVASSLNIDTAGQTRAGGHIIDVANREFQVFSHGGGHLVVDVTGYFTGASAKEATSGLFVPGAPRRVLDTRTLAQQRFAGHVNTVTIGAPDAGVLAVVGNWTLVRPHTAAFVTAYRPGLSRPETSTVNSNDAASAIIANFAVTRANQGGVEAFTSSRAHLVVDVAGHFVGDPHETNVATPVGPRDVPGGADSRAGQACAAGRTARDLNAYFNAENARLVGADYQRTTPLPDGRILWTFQDAMVRNARGVVELVHNAALVQTGNCFAPLFTNAGGQARSWLMDQHTRNRAVWFWPLSSTIDAGGNIATFVAEMHERGERYLSRTEPTRTWLVTVNSNTFDVMSSVPAPNSSNELYGFSITSDAQYTYMYGHCYKQFGWGSFGFGRCAQSMKLARVPRLQMSAFPQYWDGAGWSNNAASAATVFGVGDQFSGANALDVIFDGTKFVGISKPGDWLGNVVNFYTSPTAQGPWTRTASIGEPLRCERAACNSYAPLWADLDFGAGPQMWSISHNRWSDHLDAYYRPSFYSLPR